MLTVQCHVDTPREDDPSGAVYRELAALDLSSCVSPGSSVAIPVGSRGIRNLVTIIGSTVSFLKDLGFVPFIVPAMGSHGGGTADGQLKVLGSLGITEESTGVPIYASMDTVVIGHTPRGLPVHVDRYASDADAVIVINRIKPHTELRGSVESGLLKMMLIGLGKLEGAALYHRAAVHAGFSTLAGEAVPVVLERAVVVGGLAILENARDETARIVAIRPEEMFKKEALLLKEALALMARLPFSEADVLLVDRMGKNISGVGVDPNVTGRGSLDSWERKQKGLRPRGAEITRLVVRELTPETQGNALGIGLVDFIPRRLEEQIDWDKTGLNAITAMVPYKARRPVVLADDRECLSCAITTCGLVEPASVRLMHISDTLNLEWVRLSEAYRGEIDKRTDLKIVGEGNYLEFDSSGSLKHPVTDLY